MSDFRAALFAVAPPAASTKTAQKNARRREMHGRKVASTSTAGRAAKAAAAGPGAAPDGYREHRQRALWVRKHGSSMDGVPIVACEHVDDYRAAIAQNVLATGTFCAFD
jgi:hypothetical protein